MSEIPSKRKKIDPNKEYRTRSGCQVMGLKIVPRNSAGGLVTYPVKGTVIRREKPRKIEYQIWSIYGETNVVWPGLKSEDDLVEVL